MTDKPLTDEEEMKIHHAKTTGEAIDDLQAFLECDLYTLFRPEISFPAKRGGKKVKVKFYRRDYFRNEHQFHEYLKRHFNILRREIKRIKAREARRK